MHHTSLRIATILLAATSLASAQTTPATQPSYPDLDAIQTKIEGKLGGSDSSSWEESSKGIVRARWKDFRTAAAKSTAADKEMVGVFEMAPGRPLEIKHANGRWFVVIEKKELPAALIDNQLLFTTGDVVIAPGATNTGPRAASLEMFSIRKTPAGLSFQNVSPNDPGVILKKANK